MNKGLIIKIKLSLFPLNRHGIPSIVITKLYLFFPELVLKSIKNMNYVQNEVYK